MSKHTQNFYDWELEKMSQDISNKANQIGKRPPYHLQYIRNGGLNIKPEDKTDETVLRKQQ